MLKPKIENKALTVEQARQRASTADTELRRAREDVESLTADIGRAEALGDHKQAENLREKLEEAERRVRTAERRSEQSAVALDVTRQEAAKAATEAIAAKQQNTAARLRKVGEKIEAAAEDLVSALAEFDALFEENRAIDSEARDIRRLHPLAEIGPMSPHRAARVPGTLVAAANDVRRQLQHLPRWREKNTD